DLDASLVEQLAARHVEARRKATFRVHVGVREILAAARAAGLGTAVVSNNSRLELEAMLAAAGLRREVDEVVGNDVRGLRIKPEPDAYFEAARRLSAAPSKCVAVEDSLLG